MLAGYGSGRPTTLTQEPGSFADPAQVALMSSGLYGSSAAPDANAQVASASDQCLTSERHLPYGLALDAWLKDWVSWLIMAHRYLWRRLCLHYHHLDTE